MLKILELLLDAVFPPRTSELMVRSLDEKIVRGLFAPAIHNNFFYLTRYSHPHIKALIKENKYHANTRACYLLSILLKEWVLHHNEKQLIFVPIPLSSKRLQERGYNQVEVVLKELDKDMLRLAPLLRRSKHTTAQTTLTKSERLKNMKEVFEYIHKNTLDLEHATVVIFDDVTTTGATFKAAHEALLPHLPASTTLLCLALAH